VHRGRVDLEAPSVTDARGGIRDRHGHRPTFIILADVQVGVVLRCQLHAVGARRRLGEAERRHTGVVGDRGRPLYQSFEAAGVGDHDLLTGEQVVEAVRHREGDLPGLSGRCFGWGDRGDTALGGV